jgi:S1-C subfamily serine protease/cytochrome c-type biogenesis protein CcmH/NrfG
MILRAGSYHRSLERSMPRPNAVLLLPILFLAVAPVQSRPQQPRNQLTVSDIVKRSHGAVVQIVVSDQDGSKVSLGSGFIVSADGKVVTNFHVIEGAHSATVKLANGSSFSVEGVLAVDIEKDLALLKVDGTALPFLNLESTRTPQVGDHVVAIGSPLGLDGTVSDGIVSALREEGSGKSWIQTTAPVSHGNSGGPLLDMAGSVVGVITWGVDLKEGQNLNFAIPSGEVRSLVSSAHEMVSFDTLKTPHNDAAKDRSRSQQNADQKRAESLVDEGIKAIESKQYEQAVHILKEAIGLDPENANAWHGLGVAHTFLGQPEESVGDFKAAVKYNPSYEGYWISLGLGYLTLNRYADALPALQEAVGIRPSDAIAWLYLGKTYDSMHNHDQSLRCYQQATSLDPDNAQAWYELGQASGSIAAFNKSVQLKPDYAKAWAGLALAYDNDKHYEDAIAAWKKLLTLKADDTFLTPARIWWFIGGAYEKLNDLKGAEQGYLEALQTAQAMPYHTSADNDLIGNVFEALYLTYDKMGKHRESEKYRQNFVYWEQNKPR